MSAGYKLPFLSKKRRIIDAEQHAHGWFIHTDNRQGFRVFNISDSIPDIKIIQAYNRTDITGKNFRYFFLSHPFKNIQFLDLHFLHCSICLQ